eukprot:gene352-633_t
MNIFAVLESDDEEEQVMPPTPPPAKVAKKAPAATTVAPKTIEPKAKQTQNNAAPQTNNKKSPAPAQQTTSADAADTVVSKPTNRGENRDDHHHGRHEGGRGAGRGRGRQGGDREGGGAPRKREFDRHSGTGRGKEVSKGGSGGHNWGNEKTEALNAEKDPVAAEATADEEAAKVDAAVELAEGSAWDADTPSPKVEEVAPPEPEVPTFTLDEYLAKREQARANADLFGTVSERTVNEEDYAGLKTKEAEEVVFLALGDSKQVKAKKTDQRSNASKANQVIELGFKNASLAQSASREEGGRGRGRGGRGGEGRGGSGRGGRGEGRGEGRGGRREGRSDRPPRDNRRGGPGASIDINDSSAFPSL